MRHASALLVPAIVVFASCREPAQDVQPKQAGVGSASSSARMACEGTTINVPSKAYCLMRTRRNFEDAERDCERMGGRLASFDVAGQDKAVFTAVQSPWGYGSGLWLGCSDSEQEGTWKCGDKPIGFSNWAPGKPDNDTALDDCAEWLADTGAWNDAACVWQLGFLCRGDASLRCSGKKVTARGATFCAHGEELRDWDGAKKACADSGGTLASFASAEESKVVFDALKLPSAIPSWTPQEGLWIGLSDAVEEGKFKWANGAPLSGGNWRPGEPDNANDEDCVTLTLNDGKWGDLDCGTPLPYICEAK
jgi:hypothetical protein